jgi:hypothetical protein
MYVCVCVCVCVCARVRVRARTHFLDTAVSNSDYICVEWQHVGNLIGRDFQESDHGIFQDIIPPFCLEALSKTTKTINIACLRAKIWNPDPPNTKQECLTTRPWHSDDTESPNQILYLAKFRHNLKCTLSLATVD